MEVGLMDSLGFGPYPSSFSFSYFLSGFRGAYTAGLRVVLYKLESVDCVLTAIALRMHFGRPEIDCLFKNRFSELELSILACNSMTTPLQSSHLGQLHPMRGKTRIFFL